ncbi:serine/threonine protein kinase [Trichophyton tonsurans CBS 112818]|uniref:Serine/threonine protein kinase n=1 Tax=Trichophyton tonsurans (strain CBS 112818) TaxID=647933 RepID=F2RR38_TRIT1|nr:serine/threonine protein kinase [Trichophyton tonsurans CBS 112818]
MSQEVDYKALLLEAEERARQEKELRLQAEARASQEREQRQQATQKTTLDEYLWGCHRLMSVPIRVRNVEHSTQGSINKPTGKVCPRYLREWGDCSGILQYFYQRVYDFLQHERLFFPLITLEGLGQFLDQPIGSEKDIEFYGRLAVERHVHNIIKQLCKIEEAREDFQLGEEITFENHANTIDDPDNDTDADYSSIIDHAFAYQFCIHKVKGGATTLLTTVEYKPPHKLSPENLQSGLRPMDLWEEVVQRDVKTIPPEEKIQYNAEKISASVLVQEYHVMITEGLEYSYVTNGISYVFLHVPEDDPQTLYYFLCKPNDDVRANDIGPWTAIARVLAFCLMCCRSTNRDHVWRNHQLRRGLRWETDLNYVRSQIPREELRQTPPGSEYIPSSPPAGSFTAPDNRRGIRTRSQTRCAPNTETQGSGPTDSDSYPEAPSGSRAHLGGRKRNLSELTSSSSSQQGEVTGQRGHRGHVQQRRQHIESFCTQKCLLGLRRGTRLDMSCPNVDRHKQGNATSTHHPISADQLVSLINRQLDENIDLDCTPYGQHGSYGQPFKVTCRSYGYTVLGKGTTAFRWNEVQREVEVYRFLQAAQGSAVPVFLGPINLDMVYHVHGEGSIRHMLLMGFGGEEVGKRTGELASHIEQSTRELHDLGVFHGDLKPNNMLWNTELQRVLLIDFHDSKPMLPLERTKKKQKVMNRENKKKGLKRLMDKGETNDGVKRTRLHLCET